MTFWFCILTPVILGAAPGDPAPAQAAPANEPHDARVVQAHTAAELEKLGGLPIQIVLDPNHDALKSAEFEARCEKLVIEALAKYGVKARGAKSKKKHALLLRLEVSGGVTDEDSVASGRRVAVSLSAAATLRHDELALRRFTVKSRYTRGSVQNAGAFAMKHAAQEIGPKLITALDAWAKNE